MKNKNRLAQETSPYLLQHADNPVDWHPWGAEALECSIRENKPILLSIGYSACHWCHVMAHESFEDNETAMLMNDLYINIKVDREERPDIDKIYQLAQSLITRRSGGWPLTMFLTPQQMPFFGGTYFPKVPSHGMLAFKDLLKRVHQYHLEHNDDIEAQNISMLDFLKSVGKNLEPVQNISADPLETACDELQMLFDPKDGGFGQAPKFPHTGNIEFSLRQWLRSKHPGPAKTKLLHICTHTLTQMANGGLYDQLAGGFYRYSVDAQWMIPHFEKMLYDNSLLMHSYTQAWQATQNPLFQEKVLQSANWVLRDMQANEGGYYSSLDADSEDHEGKYYVWSPGEVQQHLSASEYRLFSSVYGLDQAANFEGSWHLHTYLPLAEAAAQLDLDIETAQGLFNDAKNTLQSVRQQRIRPHRDDKVLTSWNAMMIKSMALAGWVFETPELITSAENALRFIRQQLWNNNRLLASFKDGRAHLNAYLDDYAFLLDAVLQLLQVRWRNEDLLFCKQLADCLLQQFQDTDGGFYFTSNDHEELIHRPKVQADEATPSGAAVATFALQRLGYLLGDNKYLSAAEDAIKAALPEIQQSSLAYATFLNALDEYIAAPILVVLRGTEKNMQPWQRYVLNAYRPHVAVYMIDNMQENLPDNLAQRIPGENTIAYICEGTSCRAPINDIDTFKKTIDEL